MVVGGALLMGNECLVAAAVDGMAEAVLTAGAECADGSPGWRP